MPESKKLTAKQQRFCEEYLIDLNGTQAAIRAGYSTNSANELAAETLAKPSIKAEIQRLMALRSNRTQVTKDDVINRLNEIANADLFVILKAAQNEQYDSLSVADRRSVKAIKIRTSKTKDGGYTEDISIQLHDVVKPLELLGKHLGMFTSPSEDKQSSSVTE